METGWWFGTCFIENNTPISWKILGNLQSKVMNLVVSYDLFWIFLVYPIWWPPVDRQIYPIRRVGQPPTSWFMIAKLLQNLVTQYFTRVSLGVYGGYIYGQWGLWWVETSQVPLYGATDPRRTLPVPGAFGSLVGSYLGPVGQVLGLDLRTGTWPT